jgi:RsmE family RNA methyltransferase
MNIVLLEPEEVAAAGLVEITGRRARHVAAVLRKSVGDPLRVGVIGGSIGRASIVAISNEAVTLACCFGEQPPPPHPATLVLALPRPPVLRRVLAHCAAIGVKRIVVLHTARVEKSYWHSPALDEARVREQLVAGLEQGVDTVLPTISFARRLRPFVEDELAPLAAGAPIFLADPAAERACPADLGSPCVVIVGPEGGFVPFERELLQGNEAVPIGLGHRVLRVETAVAALLMRLAVV